MFSDESAPEDLIAWSLFSPIRVDGDHYQRPSPSGPGRLRTPFSSIGFRRLLALRFCFGEQNGLPLIPVTLEPGPNGLAATR